MAVYVDDGRWPLGRMRMCHMWADTLPELLAMADAIGVDRRWLQEPGAPGSSAASWTHFDICLAKRAAAVRAGAVETDRYGPLEHKARGDIASRDPARRRRGEIVLAQVERSRARRAQDATGLPLFSASAEGART